MNIILIGILVVMFTSAAVYAYVGYSGNSDLSAHYMTEQKWSDSTCGGCHIGVYSDVELSSHVEQDLKKWAPFMEFGVDIDSLDDETRVITYGQVHPGGGYMADHGVSVDCMICHDQVSGYDFQARSEKIATGNFADANEAAIEEQREKLQQHPIYVASYALDVLTPLPVVMEVHDHIFGSPKREMCGTSCHVNDIATTAVTWASADEAAYDVHASLKCQDCHTTTDHNIGGTTVLSSEGHVMTQSGVKDCASSGCHEGISHGPMVDAHLTSVSCEACHIPALPGSDITGYPVVEEFSWDSGVREDIIHETEFKPTIAWSRGTYQDMLPTVQERKDDSVLKPFNVITGTWWDKGFDPQVVADPDNSSAIGDPIPPAYVLKADADGDGVVTREEMRALDLNMDGTSDYPNAVLRNVTMYYQVSHNVASTSTGLGEPLECADCHGSTATAIDWVALGYGKDPAETDPPTDFTTMRTDVTRKGERPTEVEREPAFRGILSNILGR